jgi:hypothetical protein
MGYSITTKDGITVSDIPDDIKPDDPILKDHVAKIRAGKLETPGMAKSALAGLGYGTGQVGLTLQELAGKGLSALGAEETGKALQEDVAQGRQKLKSEFFPYQVANPMSAGTGEFAAEAALTAPVGGVIAKPFMAAAKYAPAAGRIGQAIESAGFNVAPAATTMGKVGNAALRVGGGAVTGGAAAGLVNPEDVGSGAGAGALFGAAAKPIGSLFGAGLRKLVPEQAAALEAEGATANGLKQLVRDLEDSGVAPENIPKETLDWVGSQLLQAYRQGKEIDPAALLRKHDFELLGIQPLRGQITRDAAQYAQEKNLRGAMPAIQERLTEQNRTLQDIFGKPASQAQEAYQAGNVLMGELGAQEAAASKRVSDLYKAARQSAGKDLEVPMGGLANDFGDVMSRYSQNVLNALPIKEFEKYGLMGGKQTKLFTVEEADKLLKTINANKSNDPAVLNALGELRTAVKNSVMNIAEDGGVFAPAVKAAKERFQMLEEIPAMGAVQSKAAIPDNFVQKYVIKSDTNSVKRLAEALRDTPAFDQAKAQMAEDIRRAAFGEGITADAAIRPEMLARKLRELGSEKMSAFFSPSEMQRYEAAVRVANYIEKHPNATPVNTSNTLVASLMQSPMGKLAGRAASHIPGADIAVGAANAVTGAVKNEVAAGKALKAEIPATKLELNEAQRKLLAKVLGGAGAAAGVLGQ